VFFFTKKRTKSKPNLRKQKHQTDALFSKRYLSFLVCFCGQFAVLSVPSEPVSSLMYTYCDLLVRHFFATCFCTFLRSVIHSSFLLRAACVLLKPFHKFGCHLASTRAKFNDTLCYMEIPDPLKRRRICRFGSSTLS